MTEQEQLTAIRYHNSFPFRSLWFCISPDGVERIFICRATAHTAHNLARKGWTVSKVTFNG